PLPETGEGKKWSAIHCARARHSHEGGNPGSCFFRYNIPMILVTGATGFVGSHLVKRLASSGVAVRALVRNREKARKLFTAPPSTNAGHGAHGVPGASRPTIETGDALLPNIELATGDVGDLESLVRAAEGCEAVVHLVGIIQPAQGQSFRSIHVEGTKNVLEAAKTAGTVRHFVYQSALGTRPNARSEYHKTKYMAEELTRSSGLNWTITRPSIIYGPGDEFTLRMKSLMELPLPFVPLLGSGKGLFQPVYIDDLAEALARITGEPKYYGKVAELCGPRRLTLDEVVRKIAAAIGKKKSLAHMPILFASPAVMAMEKLLPKPPVTLDQLLMLQEDNVCTANFMDELGIKPVDFR
ncbi:MAG: complex I NDUFA9 subunit family protein, partial [Nitrospirota bacterium]